MIKLKKLLLESPDVIDSDTISVSFFDKEARAFGMHNNKMYIGAGGEPHYKISDNYKKNIPRTRSKFKYPGRIWKKSKVISFWTYPPRNEMGEVIKLLEKEMKIKIWNNSWLLEIVIGKGGKYIDPKLVGGEEGYPQWYNNENTTALIPITDYIGSKEQLNKGKSHVKSPVLKQKKSVPAGVGSKKKIKGALKGEVPAATRFRQRKGLGDGIIKISNLIKEQLQYLIKM